MPADRPLPDAVMAYMSAAEPVQRQLQQVLTQAAGYALMIMTRGRRAVLLDAPVTEARHSLACAAAALDDLRVPDPARHHHHHLAAAAATVGRSLDALVGCLRPGADDPARAALTRDLRIATDHLRATARLLPGFEMVDLSQACCAAHVGQQASMLMCQAAEG